MNTSQLLIILLLAVLFGSLVEGFSSPAPVPDNAKYSKKLGTMKTIGLEMGKLDRVSPYCYDASCADNS